MIKKIIIHTVLGLILVLMLMFAFLMTPVGIKFAIYSASKIAPATIQYEKINADFTGPITISKLDYKSESMDAHIGNAIISWNPLGLFKNELIINKLNINNINIKLKENKTNTPEPTETKTSASKPEPFSLPLQIDINDGEINNIIIHHPDLSKTVHIETIKLNGVLKKHNMNLKLSSEISQPVQTKINFSITGTIKYYLMNLSINNELLAWKLSGTGNQNGINFDISHTKLLNGNLDGTANFTWFPNLTWSTNLQGSNINTENIDIKLPKDLGLNIKSSGSIKKDILKTQSTLLLKTTGNTINLNIDVNNEINAKWSIKMLDAEQLYSRLQGKIISQGQFSGSLKRPISTGSIQASNIHYLKNKIKSINGHWKINLTNNSKSTLNLKFDKLNIDNNIIESILVNAYGNLKHHTISLAANHSYLGFFNFLLQGSLDKNIWKTDIKNIKIKSGVLSNWKNKKPFKLIITPTEFSLDKSCLYNDRNKSLCLQLHSTPDKWSVDLQSDPLNLSQFLTTHKRNFAMTGTTQFSLNANGSSNALYNANSTINFSKGKLHIVEDKNTLDLLYDPSKIALDSNGKSTDLNINLNLPGKDHFSGKIKLNADSNSFSDLNKAALSGQFNAFVKNIAAISGLIPQVTFDKGKLKSNLSFDGSVDKPVVSGALSIEQSEIKIPSTNITLTNFMLGLNIKNNLVAFKINGLSSGNPLSITGSSDILAPDFKLDANVKGDSVLVMNTPEYKVFATPSIKLNISGEHLNLAGNITVPAATIKPRPVVSTVTLPENEIEFIGENPIAKKPALLTSIDLNIKIADKVRVSAFGLKTRLSGELQLNQKNSDTLFANGRIDTLEGSFAAYGHALKIADNSHILYTNNPIDNPYFDITAFKKIRVSSQSSPLSSETMTVGIIIKGNAKKPSITLYSEPIMLTQADIMSYLLFGYAGNGGSGVGALTSLGSSLADGGDSSGGLTSNLQKSLGITELGVENETTLDAAGNSVDQNSSFVIGKRITRRLHFRYSYGYTSLIPLSLYELRYFLSHGWTVQTGYSQLGSGFDIMYTAQSKH